jgi:hypothetical protein
MKSLRLLFSIYFLLALSTTLSATIHAKKPDDSLQEVIAPYIQFLNLEAIAKGQRIYARSTDISYFYHWHDNIASTLLCHEASYYDASITTIFDKTSDPELFGKQEVNIRPVNSTHWQKLESKIWRIEMIDGIKYVVHFYEDFCVYTSSDTQFVLSN